MVILFPQPSIKQLNCPPPLHFPGAEVDHFPFRKYTAEERSGHRQAFYDMYENATGPGVDDVGLDDADILGMPVAVVAVVAVRGGSAVLPNPTGHAFAPPHALTRQPRTQASSRDRSRAGTCCRRSAWCGLGSTTSCRRSSTRTRSSRSVKVGLSIGGCAVG